MNNLDVRYGMHPQHVKQLDSSALRQEFLINKVFVANKVTMTYSHIDRIIVGGIYPVECEVSIDESFDDLLGTHFFLERRELGLINIGGPCLVNADDEKFLVDYEEALYVGADTEYLSFSSEDPANPAKLYFNCVPAHTRYPTTHVTLEEALSVNIGSAETCNERIINKFFVPEVLQTCQLSMGLTRLAAGSNWNTMPCHTHERRMEVYFYFDLNPQAAVFHMMGEPQETRHILMHNEQAVISPSWSIHSGVGTENYAFIWGMCGENQTYDDMDHVAIQDIR